MYFIMYFIIMYISPGTGGEQDLFLSLSAIFLNYYLSEANTEPFSSHSVTVSSRKVVTVLLPLTSIDWAA